MEEVWKDVIGYEGLYQVSNLGRVKRVTTGRILKWNVQQMKQYKRVYVVLSKKSVEKSFYVHKLVAFAFPEICGEWFEGAEIDHIDGDATNNMASNLRFVTHTENMNNPITRKNISNGHSGRTLTVEHKNKIKQSMTNNPLTSEKVMQYDLDGNFIKEWDSIAECRRCGFTGVFDCLSGRLKTAKGFIWKYKEKRTA